MRRIFYNRYPETGIGLLRIAIGLLLLLVHGWPTLMNLLAGETGDYPDPLGFGSPATMALMTFAEFFCAGLLALGLFTRLALLPLITGFAVAFFIHHAPEPLAYKELSLHYLLVFCILFITGPGSFSLDSWLRKSGKTT